MRRLAIAASGGTGLLVVAFLGLVAVISLGPAYSHAFVTWADIGDIATLVAFLAMGVLVILKRPGNLVGWALLLSGLGQLLGGVIDGYAELALLQRPGRGLPLGTSAAAWQAGTWALLMAGVFLLLIVFPTGHVSSRWVARWTTAVLASFALVWLGDAAAPGHLDAPFKAYRSPLAPTQDKTVFFATAVPVIVFCLLSVAAAAIRAVVRFRRSRGLERQQFKWLAANATVLALSLPFAAAFNYSSVAGDAFGLALIALPFSVGIAVLRYRLYEIDRIDLEDARLRLADRHSRRCLRRARAREARRCSRRLPAARTWRSPPRRSSSPRSSCRSGRGCSASSTAASTAGATTPSARWRRSGSGSGSRSTSAWSARASRRCATARACQHDALARRTSGMQPAHVSVWLRSAAAMSRVGRGEDRLGDRRSARCCSARRGSR